jgi:hypothetical protein
MNETLHLILWYLLCILIGCWFGWYGWEWKWGRWRSIYVALLVMAACWALIFVLPKAIWGWPT